MNRQELADRFRQYTTARLDFLRYKSGLVAEPRLISQAVHSPAPRCFFSSGEVPQLCSRLRQRFPKEAEQIVLRAERICQHRFDLLGYTDLDYGVEIDWHCDRVHGKRAPRKPWFSIRYLDFAEVGDSKVTWELNRHQHFVTLAKAFHLTGEQRFADEIFAQWKHWHRENPYPIGINWASSLEVAFRSLAWLWTYYLMSGSAAMPAEFRAEFVRQLAVSGRHIECYLSTYFSPNTHLLGEATALFFLGALCPELRDASRWQQRGWSILQNESDRQVRDDGLHFEHSTYYHVYALDFFLHAAILAEQNGMTIPSQFKQTLKRMLEALCVLGSHGPAARLGDDDGGRLFDPRRNGSEGLLDPLATGAVLFGRGDFKSVAGEPREETLWLLGEAGIVKFDQLPITSPALNSTAFCDSGLYVMADDSGRQLLIDAGPQGAATAGHGHADALSIVANAGGHPLLIDSGTFEYVGPDGERDRFRGSRAHNTLVVDGLDQSQPKGPFGWGRLPKVQAEVWIQGETFDLFAGCHDGYSRLAEPVIHRRIVFSRKSDFWFVRDQALGRGEHRLELNWHVSPEMSPTKGSDAAAFRGVDTGLSIVVPDNHGWSQAVLQQDWSPAYGQREPHSVLRFEKSATLPAEFVALLLPLGRGDSEESRFIPAAVASSTAPTVSYRFRTPDEDHCVIIGQQKPWELFPWSSDAEFLYWAQTRDNKRRTLIFCKGSFLAVAGKKVISSPTGLERCEIVSVDGKVESACSGHDEVVDNEMLSMILEEVGS